MPELPEVETTVRYLKPKLTGLKIRDFWADRDKVVRQAGGVSAFRKEVKNKRITKVYRRAKLIVIDIGGDKSVCIHQKISGHLLYGKWELKDGAWVAAAKGPLRDDPRNKYIRAVFELSNRYQLALADLRRFGKILLVKDRDIATLKEVRDLGPEPLEMSPGQFKDLFKKKKGRVKQVLMDPFFIAGIGNIYSDEILWKAGLHPLARVENFSEKDLVRLFKSAKEVLEKAIKLRGSSTDDYRLPSGKKGDFQNTHQAYHQTGKKCGKKDGGIIKRIKIGGRSAHFCPKHQILK